MNCRVDQILHDLRTGLERIYGDRLRGVYLFGSYARGEADAESDLDILVVLDDIQHYAQEVRRTGQLGADLSLQYGVSVTKVFVRERHWLHRSTGFLDSVREEAIPA
jgi:predicted nucleotidyltransferase